MKQATLLLLIVLYSLSTINTIAKGRDKINWKNFCDSTYVFEITSKEAEKFLKEGGNEELMKKLLYNHTATFHEYWTDHPKQGHFILANINQNKIDFRYKPQMPFQVFLFKEYGYLTLQVIDEEGTIRKDAKVKIQTGRWRLFDSAINFNEDTQTYRIDDWSENTQRILTVELDKFKAYFDLNKHLVFPWNRGNYGGYSSGPSFYSYMITDKNKYKPTEKVRFKSYALKGNKKPIKDDLDVWISTSDYKYKKIKTISPYNPGGFAGEIQIHDSLELKLDKHYYIQLKDKKGRIVTSTSFQYEDYELYDNKLEVKANDLHYYPEDYPLEIKITDANGLIMPDMESKITIYRNRIDKSYVELLITPRIIYQETIKLDNTQPTTYKIPASLFEKMDGIYTVDVETITNDGQRLNFSKNVHFYKSDYTISYDTQGDSITFKFFELGKEKEVSALLYSDEEKEFKEIHLPYSDKFIQTVNKYTITVPEYSSSNTFYTSNMKSKLAIEGGIVKDSLKLEMVNPLNLDVSWFLYEGNRLLNNGFGKEFTYEQEFIDQDITYYLEIFYALGGEEQVFRKVYVPKKEYLNIETNLPDRAYPGQTLDTKIKVSDSRGKGLKDVDLTAFAYNSLLDYYVPDLPYYGNTPKGREHRSSYSIDERTVSYSSHLTHENYDFWNKIAHLDKMTYYQFTYPDPRLHKDLVFSPDQVASYLDIPYHDTFKFLIDTPEGTTEFAPYVMKDGKQQEIYVIELDEVPVYFSWVEQPQAYSFLTESDKYHKITIRLYDRAIIIDNYCFDHGKKTIISLNLDNMPASKYVRTIELDTRDKYGNYHLTDNEKRKYNKYISVMPVDADRYFYMQRNGIKYPIHHPKLTKYKKEKIVGPLEDGDYQYMDGIEYFHEGGYSYKFSKNVVYKYPTTSYPNKLSDNQSLDFSTLNDFHLTPKEFITRIGIVDSDEKWFPKIINLNYTKIHIPKAKENIGVHSLIMRNRDTSKFFVPAYKRNIISYNYAKAADYLFGVDKMEYGHYDVILLYANGNYLRYDNIPFTKDTYIELKLDNCIEYPKDSESSKWLEYQVYSDGYVYMPDLDYKSPIQRRTLYTRTTFSAANDVQGSVLDNQGEPLIGVSVHIKGTDIGTMTDIDGRFILDLHGERNTLVFSYVGYETKEQEVQRGTNINITLEESTQFLEEVVVVGYGLQKKSMMTASMSSVSYSGDTPPAPEEKLEVDDNYEGTEEDAEDRLYHELMQLDGLRTNFSDVGFWEPALVTNRKGEVDFSVTIPDNITQWNAVIYAMNRKLKTGTARKEIKSYKPLMAELKTPQFLVEGDISYFATNIRNYTKDKTIIGKVSFEQEGDTLQQKSIEFDASYPDLIEVQTPNIDSLTSIYRFTRNDGYSDGEQRTIPILQQGTEIAIGDNLEFLRNGETKSIIPQSDEDVHVSISGKQLDIYMDATYYLTGYKYACNEQLASKLIGLLNYRLYKQFQEEKFTHDKDVSEIIKRLTENQNGAKLWSWWGKSSSTSYWMSAHILRALHLAKKAGYQVNLDLRDLEYDYTDIHLFRGTSLRDIEVLSALVDWGTKQNYKEAIELFEEKIAQIEAREDSLVRRYKKTKDPLKYARKNSYMKEKLLLTEMRQKLGLEYDRSLISNNLRKDVLGALRIVDSLRSYYWYSNNDASNIIAYRIVKNDSTLMHHKEAMQMHILGTKANGWNTYQASSAVMSILPDLLAESISKENTATVTLSGKENKTIKEFPYTTIVQPGEKLLIKKESGIPLIYSSHIVKRRKEKHSGDAFDIKTTLSASSLQKGVPVLLNVEVKVKEENAEHIIIEVPIPAGCSYANKKQSYSRHEVHREYFKEYTAIFCEKLPVGEYQFTIELLPRYSGSYSINPAKIEMMYFPVINANNDISRVNIVER